MMYRTSFLSIFTAVAAVTGLSGSSQAAAVDFTTVYSQTSSTSNQLRSVALADDGSSVYVGLIQTSGNRRLLQLDTTPPSSSIVNTHLSDSDQPKAIATDDRGNVFVANRNSGATQSFIQSFNSTLTPNANITPGQSATVGGLDVVKTGSNYYAYAVFESSGLIQRYDVTDPNAMAIDNTFGTLGSFNISGATDLRGVAVAADGTIYAASRSDAKIYKISADLSTTTSVDLARAFDVDLYDGKLYATSYNGSGSVIGVFDAATLANLDTITVAQLDGGAYSRGASEGWAGLDIDAQGRIWLADQSFGNVGGTQDRLLVSAPIPEPTTLAAIAGVAIIALRRNRRRA